MSDDKILAIEFGDPENPLAVAAFILTAQIARQRKMAAIRMMPCALTRLQTGSIKAGIFERKG